MKKKLLFFVFALIMFSGFVSAITISDVEVGRLTPGQSADLKIEISNTLNEDVEDVSLALILEDTQFTTIGSSEDSEEKIREDDEEVFSFKLKASPNLAPGDYNIPYKIIYKNQDNEQIEKNGSFGISVSAETELIYSIETKNNVVGKQGQISLQVINAGLGEIKFVSVKLQGAGFEILSNSLDYSDSIESGDDETFDFDVLFQKENLNAQTNIKYKDSENQDKGETKNFIVKVYSEQEALKRGIISKNNTFLYFGILIVLIIVFFIYRRIRRKKRNNKKKD